MWPSAAPSHKSRVVAASHLSPDQDEASDVHLLSGALLAIQLLPPSLEMKIGLGHPSGPPPAATANLVASAEEATALQSNWLDQVSLQSRGHPPPPTARHPPRRRRRRMARRRRQPRSK